jgi:hypothetical protein
MKYIYVHLSDRMPERMPERMSGRIPDENSKRVPDGMSDINST